MDNTGNDRGRQLVMQELIEPYFKREATYVGVELEYPVINNGGDDLRRVSSEFLAYLTTHHAFTVQTQGQDGFLARAVSPKGDSVSFDFHYGQLEFSMWRDQSLAVIADRFYALFKLASVFFERRGFFLSGMGTNLLADFKAQALAYVADDFSCLVRAYMRQYTYYKSAKYIFGNMFSTQTHVEVPGGQLIDAVNLMLKLNFVHGILFSNALPHPQTLPPGMAYPKHTLNARDFNWQHSGFPATGCFDQDFKNVDELADFIAELGLWAGWQNGKRIPLPNISLNRYFARPENPAESFRLFRMFSHIALNHYHTLEIRSDCIQPVYEAFLPSAFHLGLLTCIASALKTTEAFYHEHAITTPYAVLRKMAVTGQKIVSDERMKKFMWALYDIARQGLISRGNGEEIFLEGLKPRIDALSCPAAFMKNQLEKGVSIKEMAWRYGSVNRAGL